jgi:hypothetical protein
VLALDPFFIGRGMQRENRVAANRRRGETRDQSEQRLPLKRYKIGVLYRRRNWIDKRHRQEQW